MPFQKRTLFIMSHFLVSPEVWILYFNIIFHNIKFAMEKGGRSDSSFHYTAQISLTSAK